MAYTGETASEVKQSGISSAIDDLDRVLDRAGQYAERLQKACDRINGSRPSAANNEKISTPPQSIIGSINQRRSRLVSILDNIEQSITGIEGGL